MSQQSDTYMYLNPKSGWAWDVSWEIRTPLHGGPLTVNTGESPREERESTLSQILEENVPRKYYLTPKACLGILRRASIRGKVLPEILKKALERQSKDVTLTEGSELEEEIEDQMEEETFLFGE